MDNGQQVAQYLEDLASTLVSLDVSAQFHMLIAGGAYLLLQQKRRSTEDIDFALIAVPPKQLKPDQVFRTTIQRGELAGQKSRMPHAAEFKQAVEIVAQRRGLPLDWMNDEAAVYYYDDAPEADVVFWRSFSNALYVYLPTLEYMFATKIAAYRAKDLNDIKMLVQELDIHDRDKAQAIIDAFLLPEAQEFWEVKKKLRRLFR